MKPVDFEEKNVVFGANQEEYLPLPALLNTEGTVITCWKLEPGELEKIQETGKIWFCQMTFHQPLQPQRPFAEKPHLGTPVEIIDRPKEPVEPSLTGTERPKLRIIEKSTESNDTGITDNDLLE